MSTITVSTPEIARGLLDAGADVNAIDERGWTPLARAIEMIYPEVVKTLLAAGAGRDVVIKLDGNDEVRLNDLLANVRDRLLEALRVSSSEKAKRALGDVDAIQLLLDLPDPGHP